MAVPFRTGSEPPRRAGEPDPFLEFEPERVRSLYPPTPPPPPAPPAEPHPPRPDLLGRTFSKPDSRPEPLLRQDSVVRPVPTLASLEPEPRRSAINPAVAFAIGVAGLVTASVAYYQLSQVLSRPRPPAAENGAAGVPPGAVGPGAVAAPTVTTGRLEVTSDPAGASVTVNGQPRGLTPLALAELSAGRYDVTITRGPATISRSVTVSPGSLTNIAASLALPAPPTAKVSATPSAPPAAPPASTGWVTFGAPLELRILENGRARGTTSGGRVAFSPGVHEVTLVNELYELRETVTVTVAAGRATQVTVPVRMGSLSINALPWSEVWIDGSPVGTTPLANLSVPVGSRLVVWRHPTLGERRQTVVVKARTPARVGVDLNR